jgi:hypothetical protein
LTVSNHYTVGQQVTVQGTWTNKSTGAAVDPSDARLDVVSPTGVVTTYTYLLGQVMKASTGIYTYAIDTTNAPGRWQYRWWSPPGVVATAAMSEFFVDPFPIMTP